jgi:hypothetical protein
MNNHHEKEANRFCIHRANETPEQSRMRREKEAQRVNNNRANETPEMTKK